MKQTGIKQFHLRSAELKHKVCFTFVSVLVQQSGQLLSMPLN